ncbi:tyrosine-type recombinase/integrase [Streptomyces sp. NPDC048045]|uniref:tyrosine-type recombinase/integrase n=1 Tax=Streptomyces sp. NPDC048045 TaxID=3154710 RepID=UPI00342FAE12
MTIVHSSLLRQWNAFEPDLTAHLHLPDSAQPLPSKQIDPTLEKSSNGHQNPHPRHGHLLQGNGSGNQHMQHYFYGKQTFRRRWDRCLERAGVEVKYTMYSLRHYFASKCLTHGIPITDVAEWMGHKSIEVTYPIYRHLVPGSVTRAAKILNERL